MSFAVTLVYLIISSHVFMIATTTTADMELQNILHERTQPSQYQKWAQPLGRCASNVDNNSKPGSALVVNMSLELYNYATVDEQISEYTFQFFLDLEWCDERLVLINDSTKQLESDAFYIEGGNEHIDRIWKPSIFVANNDNPGQIDSDKSSSNMVRFDAKDGHVWLRKRKLLRIYCRMDFRLYPFDHQRCSVHFESNVHSVRNLLLTWGSVMIHEKVQAHEQDSHNSVHYNRKNFRTIGFQLSDTELSNSVMMNLRTGVNYSRCTLEFTLKREFTHYLMLTYLPSSMIVIASWCSFWLEITSPPARTSLGVTTMLALVTSFKAAKSQLPTISYLNVLDIWNLVCTVFIGLSLVEFAVVNFIHNTVKRQAKNAIIKQKFESYRKVQSEPLSMSHDTKVYLQSVLTEILQERQTKPDASKPTKRNQTEANLGHDSLVKMAAHNSMLQKEKERSSLAAMVPASGVNEQQPVSNDAKAIRIEPFVTFSPCEAKGRGVVSSESGTVSPTPILKRALSRPNKDSPVYRGSSPKSCTDSFNNYGQSSTQTPESTPRRRSVLITSPETKAMIEMTPEELANKIDFYSRFLFPFSFFVFNVIYWCCVFSLM